MLSYLLGLIQDFERIHGRVPVLVSLNDRHMKYLLKECPDLVSGDEPFPFGFRISVVPEDELPHPLVSVLPVMRSTGDGARLRNNAHPLQSPSYKETAVSVLTRQAYRQ